MLYKKLEMRHIYTYQFFWVQGKRACRPPDVMWSLSLVVYGNDKSKTGSLPIHAKQLMLKQKTFPLYRTTKGVFTLIILILSDYICSAQTGEQSHLASSSRNLTSNKCGLFFNEEFFVGK